MLSMFFLPFGYDYMFKVLMDMMGSYWKADLIFYCISLAFLGMHIYYSKKLKNCSK